MKHELRIVDSGLRTARENLSLTEALCTGMRAGTTPDTLRFQHFPRSAIVGRHQRLEREVNLDWVGANGVETARRMTGGGAIVMGPGILGWELIAARSRVPAALSTVTSLICNGVANGLRGFGANAAFRPRNDVEINGKKVSGTGGYFDGDALVFQGTVLIELDHNFMANALAARAQKLDKRAIATLRDRVGDLREFLGAAPPSNAVQACLAAGVAGALQMEPRKGALQPAEETAARTIHEKEIGTEAFVTGLDDFLPAPGRAHTASRQTPGGFIEASILMRGGAAGRIDRVLIAGDFFVTPPRVVADLEAHLRDRPVDGLESLAGEFLARQGAQFLGAGQGDIVSVLGEAARLAASGIKNG